MQGTISDRARGDHPVSGSLAADGGRRREVTPRPRRPESKPSTEKVMTLVHPRNLAEMSTASVATAPSAAIFDREVATFPENSHGSRLRLHGPDDRCGQLRR